MYPLFMSPVSPLLNKPLIPLSSSMLHDITLSLNDLRSISFLKLPRIDFDVLGVAGNGTIQ